MNNTVHSSSEQYPSLCASKYKIRQKSVFTASNQWLRDQSEALRDWKSQLWKKVGVEANEDLRRLGKLMISIDGPIIKI